MLDNTNSLAGFSPICVPVYPPLDVKKCFGYGAHEMQQIYKVHFFRETFVSPDRISGVPGIEYRRTYRLRWNSTTERVEHDEYAVWLAPAWRCEKCRNVFIVANLEDFHHGCTEHA